MHWVARPTILGLLSAEAQAWLKLGPRRPSKSKKKEKKGKQVTGDGAEKARYRIGYVSADFRLHPVSTAVQGLFQHHSRSQFRVYCYFNTLRYVGDDVTEDISEACDVFMRVSNEVQVCCGVVWNGRGVEWSGVVWGAMAQSGVVWCGVVWNGRGVE